MIGIAASPARFEVWYARYGRIRLIANHLVHEKIRRVINVVAKILQMIGIYRQGTD
jgi:hypothetical protein